MTNIVTRNYISDALELLVKDGIHPALARVYAARGINDPKQITEDLSQLIPFWQLKNILIMAAILADAITEKKRLLIIADYDLVQL